MDVSLHEQAAAILASLAARCSAGEGFGHMSASIYDTAWLSVLRKPDPSKTDDSQWLFPECFEFILAQQKPCGAWESYATPFDGIINTLAALLSLTKHLKTQPDHGDWTIRSQKGEKALSRMLSEWDMHSTDQVGFEILTTSLLSLLQQEGVTINFPGLETLQKVRDAKLAKLPTATLSQTASTLHHSLEGLIGHIDFDQASQWIVSDGSMMGSPASTAAYLLYSSHWDDRAEAYLRKVLDRASPHEHGSVPAAWPTTIFETTWIITTLASAGLLEKGPEALALGQFLKEQLDRQNGLLGFAPHMFPDVDDTAKALEALHHVGFKYSIKSLIQTYESSEHFFTYPGERNPSLSANCNVLIALILSEDVDQCIPQIAKAAKFLTNEVFKGQVREKWHLRELYWMMYLMRAFSLLFNKQTVALSVLELAPSLREKVPIVCLHVLSRILHAQQADGSWDGICELTSYAVLALFEITRLPWIQQLDHGSIITSMTRGKSFLGAHRPEWGSGRHMWVEKVTYASGVLSEAYCLAASKASASPLTVHMEQELRPEQSFFASEKLLTGMKKAGALLEKTPLLGGLASDRLRIAELQACFSMQLLQRQPPDIFPRSNKSKEKHLFIVPLALTTCAQLHGCVVSPSVLFEMTVLSILNFQADEYMEGVVERHFASSLDIIRNNIREMFAVLRLDESNNESSSVPPVKGDDSTSTMLQKHHSPDALRETPSVQDVRSVLRRFVTHILCHEAVQSGPRYLQTKLGYDLQTFLLAHVSQAEHNDRFRTLSLVGNPDGSARSAETNGWSNGATRTQNGTSPIKYSRPGQSFYHWLHSISADHTSCPFSFLFFNCLIYTASMQRHGILASARTVYLAEDACRHLASLCRIYNDLGSAARDADEGAVNSLNFPEFFLRSSTNKQATTKQDATAKEDLLWIAEHERQGLDMAMKKLEIELGDGDFLRSLRVFIDVTDLYGQLYVLKDVGIRTR